MDTVTTWSPSGRLTLIGVDFPVGTPSTVTSAPVGNDVIFSAPLAADIGTINQARTDARQMHCQNKRFIDFAPFDFFGYE
jgi:hypothetical protein